MKSCPTFMLLDVLLPLVYLRVHLESGTFVLLKGPGLACIVGSPRLHGLFFPGEAHVLILIWERVPNHSWRITEMHIPALYKQVSHPMSQWQIQRGCT